MGTTGWFYFCFCDRITPAYAGKSSCSRPGSLSSRDHPRVCGEKRKTGAVPAPLPGSPPRMRGKGKNTHRTGRTARITPAYAGKRSQGVAALQLGWDHPRVCGEKPHLTPAIDRSKGSPPRMRGKAVPAALPDVTHGITPACAGKSFSAPEPVLASRDHPRVCGEKVSPLSPFSPLKGSPPRVRGTVKVQSTLRLERRDHPRVCGEKGRKMKQQFIGLGSPPRMRGKGELRGEPGKDGGITPAYAGKRNPRLGHKSRVWDHPRVCGEKG